jgi:hypothetical protein
MHSLNKRGYLRLLDATGQFFLNAQKMHFGASKSSEFSWEGIPRPSAGNPFAPSALDYPPSMPSLLFLSGGNTENIFKGIDFVFF